MQMGCRELGASVNKGVIMVMWNSSRYILTVVNTKWNSPTQSIIRVYDFKCINESFNASYY